MNTKDVGERSEAMVLAVLLKAGKTVLQPFGDNQRYDLVVEEDGKFTRIQVKTARRVGDVLTIPTCSTYAHRGRSRRDYRGQADLFMAYCPDTEKVYSIPVALVGRTNVYLRLEASRNGQTKRVRWAKDFEFAG